MVFLKDSNVDMDFESKNQDEIIKLAKDNPDWHVRLAAVEYVEDECVLKDIFNKDSINAVCIRAMENITGTDFLADACLNNPDSYLRLATLNRIWDESLVSNEDLSLLLEKVVLGDPEVLVRKAALEIPIFKNQKVLCDIAGCFGEDELRRIAVSKIIDEDVLAGFALNDSNVFVRREAIQNPHLKNNNVLIEVVKRDCDEFNRYWACEKIEDADFLLKVIFDKSYASCLDVISLNSNLPTDDYFIGVYKDDENEYHRLAAANFISDATFLENIILNESDDRIRAAAIRNKNFNNQEILNELILNDSSFDVLLEVVLKIDDEVLLIDFTKNHQDSKELLLKAIGNISDFEFLEQLYEERDDDIRCHIVDRLCELKSAGSSLRNIALKENDKRISLKAIGAIGNANDLIWIADESHDRDIRIAALKNISPKRLLDNYLPKNGTIKSMDDELFESKLRNMALNDSDAEIRAIAAGKLSDKETLDEIASGGDELSLIARERLNTLFEDIKLINQEAILEYLVKSSDADVSYVAQRQLVDLKTWHDRILRVNEITDIDELKDIARNDFNYYVRCEAEGKLEKMLFNMRLDEIESDVNQERLKRIAEDEELSDDIKNKARLMIVDIKSKYLIDFEKLNNTSQSIYDIRLLIILKDGTNLTDWENVGDKRDVLYVSEDLSDFSNLYGKYCDFEGLNAIVARNVTDKVENMGKMFYNCHDLVEIETLNSWDTSGVHDMSRMFEECININNLSFLENWDVSAVKTINSMFNYCFSLGSISPLAKWDVSNVCDMSYVFDDCHSLEDISALGNWDVSNVRDMSFMFGFCNYLSDISALASWDVSKVENMKHMFEGCDDLDDVSPLKGWNVGNVCDMRRMFEGCDYLNDLSCLDEWDVSGVEYMGRIFKNCDNLSKKPLWYEK